MQKVVSEYDRMMICFTYFFFGIASLCVYGEETYYGETDILMIFGRLIGTIIFLKMLMGLKAFERFVTFCNDAAEWVKYFASKAKAKIQEFRARRTERKAEKAQRKKERQAQRFDIRKMG